MNSRRFLKNCEFKKTFKEDGFLSSTVLLASLMSAIGTYLMNATPVERDVNGAVAGMGLFVLVGLMMLLIASYVRVGMQAEATYEISVVLTIMLAIDLVFCLMAGIANWFAVFILIFVINMAIIYGESCLSKNYRNKKDSKLS